MLKSKKSSQKECWPLQRRKVCGALFKSGLWRATCKQSSHLISVPKSEKQPVIAEVGCEKRYVVNNRKIVNELRIGIGSRIKSIR